MTTDVNGLNAWDRRPRELLEEAYVAAGDGPRGARSQRACQRLVRRLDVVGHELTARSNQVETL
jgi:hypothetical protein